MIGAIDRCRKLESPKKRYFQKPFRYTSEIINIVNAIPDLIVEANRFDTIGEKKIMQYRGNK